VFDRLGQSSYSLGGGMVAVLVPHLAIPFNWDGSSAAVIEQDTIEDISACVEASCLTIIGQREELPDFGIPDPTFGIQPIDVQRIIDAVLKYEPRAALYMSQSPDEFDQLIARVLLAVSAKEVNV
jgi:hypothetical protein